ncbi:Os02g0216700, partial [Oryza sativa Japonica Group]
DASHLFLRRASTAGAPIAAQSSSSPHLPPLRRASTAGNTAAPPISGSPPIRSRLVPASPVSSDNTARAAETPTTAPPPIRSRIAPDPRTARIAHPSPRYPRSSSIARRPSPPAHRLLHALLPLLPIARLSNARSHRAAASILHASSAARAPFRPLSFTPPYPSAVSTFISPPQP